MRGKGREAVDRETESRRKERVEGNKREREQEEDNRVRGGDKGDWRERAQCPFAK